MRSHTPWPILVAGVLVSLSTPHSALGQRTPYENLVLADCGIGLGPNGGSTSREMIYYSGDVWTGNGLETHRPTMMVNVPWTGAYPWGPQGAKATMPNGDRWRVYIDPKIKDPGAAGDAWHSYEEDKPLKCYSYHWDKLYQLDDGKWCSSAYVCNHRGKPYVKPPGPPAPPPVNKPDETRITGSTNSDWVELYEMTPAYVMSIAKQKFSSASYACDNTPTSIGSGCSIEWWCHGDPAMKAIERMSGAFDAMARRPEFSSKRQEEHDICIRYDTRPGREGQCLRWTTKVDNYVKIPRTIELTMDNIPPPGSGRNPSVHGYMKYQITCRTSSLECKLCNVIGTALSIPSGGLGASVLLGCQLSPLC